MPRAYEGDYRAKAEQADAESGWSWTGKADRAEQAVNRYAEAEATKLDALAKRGDAPSSDADHLGRTHEELHGFVNAELDPEDIAEKGRLANDLGNWLDAVATDARTAMQAEESAWQGGTAQQAAGFVGGAASWMETTRDGAYLNAHEYDAQADRSANARTAMPEPTGFDQQAEMNEVWDQAKSGDFFAAIDSYAAIAPKQEAAQAAHEQAAWVVTDQDSGYMLSADNQPEFAPPPTLGGSTATVEHRAAPIQGGFNAPDVGAPSQDGTSASSFAPSGPSGAPPVGAGPGAPAPSATGPALGGHTSGATPPGFTPNTPNTPTGRPFPTGGGGGLPFGGVLDPGAANRGNANTSQPRAGGGRFGSGAGQRVSGGSGSGSASGRVGEGAAKGAQTGAPGSGKGSSATPYKAEPGARSAVGSAAGPGGSGRPGAPGSGGMAPGGGKGKGGEDTEKKAPDFLKDPDADETFGVRPTLGPNGEKPTPPVIGER